MVKASEVDRELWHELGHRGAPFGLYCWLCGIGYMDWWDGEREQCERRPFWSWLYHLLTGDEL